MVHLQLNQRGPASVNQTKVTTLPRYLQRTSCIDDSDDFVVACTRDMSCSIEARASTFSPQRLVVWLDQDATPEFDDQRELQNASLDTHPARWDVSWISCDAEIVVPKDHEPAEAVQRILLAGWQVV